MPYPLRTALITLLIFLPVSCGAEETIEFNRDVRPILSAKCFFCHGPDTNQRQGGLRLDIEAEAKGNAIDMDHPRRSELLERIRSTDDEARMPPLDSGKSLTPEEINLIERWLDQGAPYQDHWAFLAPKRSAMDADDVSPVDYFVRRQLARELLSPAPPADRATLLRRLSLDLTGLPPLSSEVEDFVHDKSPEAYETVVDRLLGSPRYGEHMARYWMDAARYADTNGYQYDLEREQWVWRDWVINAFNTNMPYDQFTVEQIAGDLLPEATPEQRLATGFHRNHPITIEGGVIDEEYRTEYVVDRVVTTSTVWMGLTMMCGRCHDHKYDPISQKDFYSFFAFFNNIAERGLNGFDPKLKVPSPYLRQQIARQEHQVALAREQYASVVGSSGLPFDRWEKQAANEHVDSWLTVIPDSMKSAGGATLTVQEDQSVLATGPNPATETYEATLLTTEPMLRAIRLEALKDPSTVNGGAGRGSNGNFVLSEFQLEVSSSDDPETFHTVKLSKAEADYSQSRYNISLAIDGRIDQSGWAVDGNTRPENRMAVFHLAEPIKEPGSRLRVRMLFRYGGSHHIVRFRLALHQSDSPPASIEMTPLLAKHAKKRTAEEKKQIRDWLLVRFAEQKDRDVFNAMVAAERELERLETNVPATMVLSEMPTPRKTHILMRGEYDKPMELVQAGTPEMLPAMASDLPQNRLGLARWLVDPSHPLTARVAVNRIWQQFFGVGIVKTVEDFGSQGQWPSHPELLDWLAVEFVESGWDVKAIVKRIVMSDTYRQSSRLSPELLERDPENRLLARGPRMRLDAEVIRDSALLASGLLSDQVGGPSVFPYHPSGLWQEINNRPRYSRTYKQDQGEKLYRRSLYTFWKRTVPPPSMAAFDAPGREYCRVRRSRTNTPLQSLVMLHDPQFVEAARVLAEDLIGDESLQDDEARLSRGFVRCYARQPNAAEGQVLLDALRYWRKHFESGQDAASELLGVGETPVDSQLEPAELAAWTTVVRTLMNLSEFVTKP